MYAAFVSTFDDYLGELRTFLAAEGLADNTILVFQSDNGHSMEERTFRGGGYSGPYRSGKFSMFEGASGFRLSSAGLKNFLKEKCAISWR